MASCSALFTAVRPSLLPTIPVKLHSRSLPSREALLSAGPASRSLKLRCTSRLRPAKCLNDAASASCANFEESYPIQTKFSGGFFRMLELVCTRVSLVAQRVWDVVEKPQTQEEAHLLTALKGRMACAAAPLFFAAISQSVNTPLTVVASGMAKWLELYSGVLMVRVLLSWFPNIPWERQPLQAMRDMCDPYLNLFRNIIPPLFNALDLSPMLAFLVLGVLTSILNTTVQSS